MSSRQEEKERRRRERLAAEEERARREAGKRRLQWIGGAVLAVVALAVVIGALVVPALSGGDEDGGGDGPSATTPTVPPPPQVDTNLASSVEKAGCTLKTFPSEGNTHTSAPQEWKYKTNPPTSGPHHPEPAADGVYPFGRQPSVGGATHALEHGRIDIQYGPQVTRRQFAQLAGLVGETEGYHQLLFRNQTRMPFAVAATAWTQMLGCKSFNPQIFDALRNFRERYTDQGPESVP